MNLSTVGLFQSIARDYGSTRDAWILVTGSSRVVRATGAGIETRAGMERQDA